MPTTFKLFNFILKEVEKRKPKISFIYTKLAVLLLGILVNLPLFSQSIIINEVTQGPNGAKEYVEFLVVGPELVNCSDVPPCLDLRLWVFDDNNGYLNGGAATGVGIASGAVRFADNPFWSCIPVGTIIVIYNDGDINPDLQPNDTDMNDGNCALTIPISSNLFDRHTSLPNSSDPSYSGTGWVSSGSWTLISMANGQDGFQIYNPSNLTTPVFSIGWGAANTLGDIWMGSSTASGDVFYATDCDYYNQASWTEGSANTTQTPGAPNNALQEDCIGLMNANCNPPTVTITSTPATCGNCEGTATATIIGGTAPFQLTWTPAPPVGQGTSTISGLCAGNFELLLVDDNGTGCSLVTPTTISASGDDIFPTASNPLPIAVQCISDVPTPDPAVVTDAADNGAPPIVTWEDDTSDGNSCPEIISRRYRVTDDCGNFIFVVQTITVDDTQAPVFAASPANITVECIGGVPAMSNLGWTDNCDGSGTVAGTDGALVGGSCGGTITRTWTYTDVCGNPATATQLITIDDNIAPTASNPAAINVACITDVPPANPADVTDAADNCGVPTVVHVGDASDGNICNGEVITRTYSVTDACGNSITVTQTITIDAITPTFTLSSTDPTACGATDGTITISGLSPGEDYDVSFNGSGVVTFSADGAGDIVLTGLSAGTYTGFEVSDVACPSCSSIITSSITLTDPTPSTVDAGANQIVCDGDQVTLTAINPNGATITWNNGISDGTPFTPIVGTTTYTVTANLAGCVLTDQVDVTVNPFPIIDAGTDQLVCDGNQVTLTAYNPNSAVITWDNGNTDGIAFTPGVGTTTYIVTADLLGCISTDQVNITVSTLPVFTLSSTDPTVCGAADGTITISGLTPGVEYEVSFNGGAQLTFIADGAGDIVFTDLTAGLYSGFEVSLNGCLALDNASINLTGPNPPTIDAGADQLVCDGDQVTLTATNPDGASITWDHGVTDGSAFTPIVGTLTYTVTANLAGCISTDQVEVTVSPLPIVDAGVDVLICEGESVTLTATGANSYNWDQGIINGEAFSPSQTETYTVVGTLGNCFAADFVTVTVNPVSDVSFNADNLSGCIPAEFTLTNTSNFQGEECEWTLGNGVTLYGCDKVSAYLTTAGCVDITLTIISTNGCSGSSTYEDYICIENDPVANFSADPLIVTTTDSEVNFINGSFGAVDYDWDFGDGSISNTENPSHTFDNTEEGNYTVQLIAYSSFGCSDTAYAIVQVQEDLIFYVPNTFTPDGNKLNDTFLPVFTSGFDPNDYNLLIFNRWGEILFESKNSEIGWDGTYGGKIVEDGTFVWKIEFKTKYTDERQVHVGHVNVLR